MSQPEGFLGLDRKLRLSWLDAMADGLRRGLPPAELRASLDALLEGEVAGQGPQSAKGKVKTVLFRVWVRVPDDVRPFRDEGLRLLEQDPSCHRLAVHWGMCLAAYPFFRDVTATVGRLLAIQGTVSLAEIKRRTMESWGERSSISRATSRLVWMLVDWSVLESTEDKEVFRRRAETILLEAPVATWLLECHFAAGRARPAPFQQLASSPALFPFRLALQPYDLRQHPRLEIVRHGLDEDLVVAREPSAAAKREISAVEQLLLAADPDGRS